LPRAKDNNMGREIWGEWGKSKSGKVFKTVGEKFVLIYTKSPSWPIQRMGNYGVAEGCGGN